jgi:hypothetical protein
MQFGRPCSAARDRCDGLRIGYDRMVDRWHDNNCPGSPPALDLGYRTIPSPDPDIRRPTVNPLMPLVGAAAAYDTYRLLRLLPSLLPPLWPTLVPNVAIP